MTRVRSISLVLWLLLLVPLLLHPLPGAAQPGAPRLELSACVAWPLSGALRKHWQHGPGAGVHWLLAEPRGVYPSCGARYNYFDHTSGSGFGTHGLRASAALRGRPGVASRVEGQVGAGVGGLWTTSRYWCRQCQVDLSPPIVEGDSRRIGQIHGWGPTLEAGLGVVLLEDEATGSRATLRALWIRTWASDTFLDQLTVEMAWGLR